MGFLDKYARQGMEQVPCNLCGGTACEPLPLRERFGTGIGPVICTRCGLIYLNPRWTPASYAAFYEDDYRRLMGEKEESPREMMLRQRVHGTAIHEFCRPFLRDGANVLDIGCDTGGVLSAFQLAGRFRLFGVEPSTEHSQFAREALGLSVVTGLFGQASLPRPSYDLVLLTQTLNHLLDPRGAMERIREILEPDGMFFVEVQNFPQYVRRTHKPVQVDHTYYFSPETLECMARRVGLEPVRIAVDTASSAAAVDRYMWHRSASLHVRMLLRRAAPESALPLPNYRRLRREVLRGVPRMRRAVTAIGQAIHRLGRAA